MPPSNPQHSAETPRWGTPLDIVERARRVMGSIDLDPCSSSYFNDVVKAGQYYSLDDRGEDGLTLPWRGNVFVNPPGKLVKEFWKKMLAEDRETFWVGFSLEQLTYLQDEDKHPTDFNFCLLRKRIRFVRHDGYSASPTHGNYVCYKGISRAAFIHEFADQGLIL